jgi:dolichol-phosphate mannosyltransferase
VNDADWQIPEHELHILAPKRHDYIVLIPVINEGERIVQQVMRMSPLADAVDIAVVDGGSTDGSIEQLLQLSTLRAVAVKRGAGRLGAQLRVGMAWALREGYEGVILIDGNGKDNPDAIPKFVAALRDGYDHIQGSRYVAGGVAENTPALRHLGVKFIHAPLISLAARHRYTDTTNGFRAYSRRFLTDRRVRPFRNVLSGYEMHYYLAIRAARTGFRVIELPVERRYPAGAVPTKIRGAAANLRLFWTLLRACAGAFNPPAE